MNINITFIEIKKMNENEYRNLIRKKCIELGFNYLMNKRGSKGKEIEYDKIRMAQYLQPNNQLEVKEQMKIFEIRNRMTNIPNNFSRKNDVKCHCGQPENMEHVYNCKFLSSEEVNVKFKKIYEENVDDLKTILKRFEQNMNNRDKQYHVIQKCDPPVSVVYESGNG